MYICNRATSLTTSFVCTMCTATRNPANHDYIYSAKNNICNINCTYLLIVGVNPCGYHVNEFHRFCTETKPERTETGRRGFVVVSGILPNAKRVQQQRR